MKLAFQISGEKVENIKMIANLTKTSYNEFSYLQVC